MDILLILFFGPRGFLVCLSSDFRVHSPYHRRDLGSRAYSIIKNTVIFLFSDSSDLSVRLAEEILYVFLYYIDSWLTYQNLNQSFILIICTFNYLSTSCDLIYCDNLFYLSCTRLYFIRFGIILQTMAFVRVKRRHDEDPYNSIVVSHKKLKPIGTDSNRNCVFKFAATLKDEVSYFICIYTFHCSNMKLDLILTLILPCNLYYN